MEVTMKPDTGKYVFNPRGRVLVHIARNPGCTINLLAGIMFLTRRTVWGVVGDLKRAGLVRSTRAPHQRELHYFIEEIQLETCLRDISTLVEV
jgi:DNA-binding MarR family transcriptional regulator